MLYKHMRSFGSKPSISSFGLSLSKIQYFSAVCFAAIYIRVHLAFSTAILVRMSLVDEMFLC